MDPSYQRALLLHGQRRYEDAERELKQVLAADPHNAEAHAMLGLCMAHRNAYAEASAETDAAVGLAPDLPFAHYAKAAVLLRRDRYEEAAAAIQEALRLNSFSPDFFTTCRGRFASPSAAGGMRWSRPRTGSQSKPTTMAAPTSARWR
jgi:tetratricopeptide (TPR) repeat protein